MQSFLSLYNRLLKAGVHKKLDIELENLNTELDFDKHHLDCLLNPIKHPPVLRLAKCSCPDDEKAACENICFFKAITHDEDGNVVISKKDCVGCGDCIGNCKPNNLAENKEAIKMLGELNESQSHIYAMIAPAYISQFSENVTPGKLRSAFKLLGFTGMIEVALFADIITLKEALEFDKAINNEKDFMLTSCCCPIWIAMIRKVYRTLIPHLPPSVSPMVACGKSIKALNKDAKTVFIGPCIAKKAEAREIDIAEAVDYVLTFEEIRDILDSADIDPTMLDEDSRDHSSKAGRIYAVTSGVSQAVKSTVNKLKPDRAIPITLKHADGIKECKILLKNILDGNIQSNFIEGMACIGGCVGGPKVLIDRKEASDNVIEYGSKAAFNTPADNPYVIELLERLGFHTIENLLESDNMFVRKLDV